MPYSTEAHLRDALTCLIPCRESLKQSGERSLMASADELLADIRDELKRREREKEPRRCVCGQYAWAHTVACAEKTRNTTKGETSK